MRVPSPQEIREALARHSVSDLPALPGRTNDVSTGVLVPLVWQPSPVCIVTVRTAELKSHAGEVCFPGGRPEEGDVDLWHTALREAHEELGIEDARALGELSSIPLYTSDYRLKPYVAEIGSTRFVVEPREVARVAEIDLAIVLGLERIEAIAWSLDGMSGLSPLFELGEDLMYGATAHSFYELLLVVAPLFDVELPPLVAGSRDWQDVLAPAQRASAVRSTR